MATSLRYEFVTPELLLVGICCRTEEFVALCEFYNVDYQKQIKEPIYAMDQEQVPDDVAEYELLPSYQYMQVLEFAAEGAQNAARTEVDVPHVLHAMLQLEESFAAYLLRTVFTKNEVELMRVILDVYDGRPFPNNASAMDELPLDFMRTEPGDWHQLVTCVNDLLAEHNPLVGREAELERTIQVLCRRDKNNPLHVGEPGVGKTALIYGLAAKIEAGDVPERLRGARIYQLDMGSLVAGTQYRGEFEDRVKAIMQGAVKEGNVIIYIDEIHTLIGAGAGSGDSLDGANMLKPYLEAGQVRFIGATTYKEYHRYFEKSPGIVRRFQLIDIPEPTPDETRCILFGLRERYEAYHGVRYDEGVLGYAVDAAVRHMSGRFLPDKAIDLIDEAGAYRQMHPMETEDGIQHVDTALINETIKRICRISDHQLEASAEGLESLATLEQRVASQVFGQEEAVRQVVEAVEMAKAGLTEPDKPLSSLLFVGPTGVGKTELCKVLAAELGVEFLRFDMSEYAEKHAVAKLIGSPAGYVGYEDGGLLTDAVRKSPSCVLLLDEIEKAHSDIYNILLQVMDYARLTDNRGNRADFRNVILIMTSNAGAQFASAGIGFDTSHTRGDSMLESVKKTFKPEFINRLSATVVFHDMSREMASLILGRKLRQLSERVAVKGISVALTDAAKTHLLDAGFSRRYGARELDRVLHRELYTLLMRPMLWGELRQGGVAAVDYQNDSLTLTVNHGI